MTKSATDLMQDIMFSAIVDAMAALKKSSAGAPNIMLRNLNSIHANSTFEDLPEELQAAIRESVRASFITMKKSGYTVSNGAPPATSRRIESPKSAPNRRAVERSR